MADVTLSYKGSDILELSDSGSATLKTGGKYCEDDIAVEYVKPSGGGSYDGFEMVTDVDNNLTEIIFHGTVVPEYGLNYFGWDINVSNQASIVPTLRFADHPTHIGSRAFHYSAVRVNFTNLDEVETIGVEYAFCVRCGSYLNHSDEIVHLPKYTGRTGGAAASSNNLFRNTDARMPKTYIMESLEVIPQYAWYGFTVQDMDVQLGSIGHAVQQSYAQPFGGTSNASGTVTIYTTGALLDTIKTGVQAHSGANLTFIYKASEATTYNGTSYNAGDTMMTSTGA